MYEDPPNNEAPIEFDVLLTLLDYSRANYWFFFKKTRLLVVVLFLGGVFYPILYLTGAIERQQPETGKGLWMVFIPAAVLLLLLISIFLASRSNFRSNISLHDQLHYSASQDGISAAGPLSSGQMSWKGVLEAFETRHNFLIFVSKKTMYVIPKRCLHSGGDINRFRQLVTTMLGRKARVRKG